MLLNGGELDGRRILGQRTVRHMVSNTSGQGSKIESQMWRRTVRLRLRARSGCTHDRGALGGSANPGEFTWTGAYGTQVFCDPKERLVAVVGTAAPEEIRKYYREQVRYIVYAAISFLQKGAMNHFVVGRQHFPRRTDCAMKPPGP